MYIVCIMPTISTIASTKLSKIVFNPRNGMSSSSCHRILKIIIINNNHKTHYGHINTYMITIHDLWYLNTKYFYWITFNLILFFILHNWLDIKLIFQKIRLLTFFSYVYVQKNHIFLIALPFWVQIWTALFFLTTIYDLKSFFLS